MSSQFKYKNVNAVHYLAFSSFQQWGCVDISAGEAGFVTGFYVILTPLLGFFLGEPTPRATWIACALSLAGLYFIAVPSGELFVINVGVFHVVSMFFVIRSLNFTFLHLSLLPRSRLPFS
jgi:drug/metabolite transporter (DMT)-like permease